MGRIKTKFKRRKNREIGLGRRFRLYICAHCQLSTVVFIYNLFIRLYLLGIRIASLWNPKAAEWIKGRKNLFAELEARIGPQDQVIWVHCASAGEFEQGKPVIEALKQSYPSYKILVSFFSPSGYWVGKKYSLADHVTYLPADTAANAKKFIDIVHPRLVVFVKYEYWFHHLNTAAFHHIPILLVSAIFRKDAVFFKSYGKFFRQLLFLFRHLFVQDEASQDLLKQNGIAHCSVSGDTRFDRVKKIASQFTELEVIPDFINESPVIIAGSTWPDDEKMLASYMKQSKAKLIIAPHEITPGHINSIQQMFPGSFTYSSVKGFLSGSHAGNAAVWERINEQQETDTRKKLATARVLIIDNIGMLSRIYHYATISYIGGGFNSSGIHNTLEAAVYGKPVLFGPNYQKFKEARDLIAVGAAYSVSDTNGLIKKLDHLLNDPILLNSSGAAAAAYVNDNTGAREKLLHYIQEKRLLTRS